MKAFGRRVLSEGLIAGLIGYAAVVLFFLVVNLIQGRSPFYTAALFGSALFYGLDDPANIVIWPGPVLAYNGVHLVVFLGLGWIAAWLASEAERGPQFWYVAITTFIFVVVHMYGAALWLTDVLQGAVSGWTVVAAGLLAATAMVVYLWNAHPRLKRQMHEYRDQPI